MAELLLQAALLHLVAELVPVVARVPAANLPRWRQGEGVKILPALQAGTDPCISLAKCRNGQGGLYISCRGVPAELPQPSTRRPAVFKLTPDYIGRVPAHGVSPQPGES